MLGLRVRGCCGGEQGIDRGLSIGEESKESVDEGEHDWKRDATE